MTNRTIPSAHHAALLELARWQFEAPVELTVDQLEVCGDKEQALLDQIGIDDLGLVTAKFAEIGEWLLFAETIDGEEVQLLSE